MTSRGVQTQLTEEAKRLLELAEKATPGPWKADGGTWVTPNGYAKYAANWIHDSAFIAAARELAPALADAYLALLEAARLVAFGVQDGEAVSIGMLQSIRKLRAAVSVGPETRETEE